MDEAEIREDRKNRNDSKNEADTRVEQCLRENGFVLLRPSGTSMRPLIKEGKAVVLLETVLEPLKKGDIILYRRFAGHPDEDGFGESKEPKATLILHRIIDIRGRELVVCGDHQWKETECIRRSQVLAVAKGFYHKKRYIDLYGTSRWLRLYTAIWNSSKTVRRLCLGILRILKLDEK